MGVVFIFVKRVLRIEYYWVNNTQMLSVPAYPQKKIEN
ncbi:hypothetical protein T08_12783 [Trichinella sp. T8]|nr:hypothetical protein T08_12783 [Trichinella sp. T8]